MEINRYGITLKRITTEDLEVLRQGRNQPHVRKYHLHQKLISPEEQLAWFNTINNPHCYYFIISQNEKNLGAVYVTNIPDSLSNSNCGIFMFMPEFQGTRTPILASYIALDFFFTEVGVKKTSSIVHEQNDSAIKLNRFFGYSVQPQKGVWMKTEQTKEGFAERNASFLKSFISRMVKSKEHVQPLYKLQENENVLREIREICQRQC